MCASSLHVGGDGSNWLQISPSFARNCRFRLSPASYQSKLGNARNVRSRHISSRVKLSWISQRHLAPRPGTALRRSEDKAMKLNETNRAAEAVVVTLDPSDASGLLERLRDSK